MSYTALTVLGFSLIFLSTTLGSSLVFFFKREISEKLNTLFWGFAARQPRTGEHGALCPPRRGLSPADSFLCFLTK